MRNETYLLKCMNNSHDYLSLPCWSDYINSLQDLHHSAILHIEDMKKKTESMKRNHNKEEKAKTISKYKTVQSDESKITKDCYLVLMEKL